MLLAARCLQVHVGVFLHVEFSFIRLLFPFLSLALFVGTLNAVVRLLSRMDMFFLLAALF